MVKQEMNTTVDNKDTPFLIIIIALICLFLGVVLWFVSASFSTTFNNWLIKIGDTLILAAIIILSYEYIIRKLSEKSLRRTISKTIKNNLKVNIAKECLNDKEFLQEILKEEKVDIIIQNCLESRLGSEIAKELFTGFIDPVIEIVGGQKKEEVYGFRQDVQINPREEDREFYNLKITTEFRAVLRDPIIKFGCVNTIEKLNELNKKEEFQYIFFLPEVKLEAMPELFDVREIKIVTEKNVVYTFDLTKANRSTDKGFYELTFTNENIHEIINKKIKLIHKIDSVLWKDDNMYYLKLVRPTKGIEIVLEVNLPGVGAISIGDCFVSAGVANIEREKPNKVKVSLEGWVFPYSGVAFSWAKKL